MKNILSLDYFTELIDKALKGGEINPRAMEQTNILNAEYVLGKFWAILEIMSEIYSIETIESIREKYRGTTDELMRRVDSSY